MALGSLLSVLRLFAPRAASNVGGAVARMVGPLLPVSRIARDNLARILPERSDAERRAILRATWDNLGRTFAELPHLSAVRWDIAGTEHLPADGPAILVSGHLANWEILPAALLAAGLPMASIHRAPDNPVVARQLRRIRRRATGGIALPLFPKGAAGARAALRHLAAGGALGILADQKMNDGIAAPFMGHLAMTPAAPAQLALRFRCPVLLGRVIRLGPARFRVIVEPPLAQPDAPPREALRALTEAINARLEAWIRERPGEWLWLHRRWPRQRED